MARLVFWTVLALLLALHNAAAAPDIVFVTQPPHPRDFATVNATFGSHRATMDSIPRGGDLYVRYGDGTLKNITAAAGYGMSGMQTTAGIAVRDPAVHWDGQKVVFSMVIGAPSKQYETGTYYWQLYEVTGLGKDQAPIITKVPNQPSNYNNVMPVYGTDDRILFVSDRPRSGQEHIYPQRDEYESSPTNTGLWSLDPSTGDLFQLDHAPSGDFSPSIDTFGRVVFTRWDHLQRDQQNRCSQPSFGAFNYASEASDAQVLDTDSEVYPEPRGTCEVPAGSTLERHSFNHFLPWQINEDGTDMETINHIGRHELVDYIGRTFNNDPNVEEFYGQYTRVNQNSVDNLFQLREDLRAPGTYYGISAPEFGTHASGQIVRFYAPPSLPADLVQVTYLTHPDTATADDSPSPNHSGLSRDPVVLSDGTLVAAHTSATAQDSNIGTTQQPQSKYSYRLKTFTGGGSYLLPGGPLTPGIVKSISFWSPDTLVTYSNVTLWELQPQELAARQRPARRSAALPATEKSVFDEAGVSVESFKEYLRQHSLALIVSRNVTTRDNLDHQQPLNLKVSGSETQTVKGPGKLYEVAHLQIFQGDLIRGYSGSSSQSGRRVLAQPLHAVSGNVPNPGGPAGSVKVAADGSLAALVPARRALTYQLTDTGGVGVVRERLWLTFQPGEIRVCTSCHGVNSKDQTGNGEPLNKPAALRELLDLWKSTAPDPGAPEPTATPNPAATAQPTPDSGAPGEGSPTPQPTLGTPGEGQPAVTLTLKARRALAAPRSKRAGTAQLTVQLTSESALGKALEVVTKVGTFECPSSRELVLDTAVFSATTRPLLLPSARVKVTHSVLLDGEVVATGSAFLQGRARRNVTMKKLCAGLQAPLK